jgi:hypothetical protein
MNILELLRGQLGGFGTPGINPNAPTPGPQPSPTPEPRWMQSLNSPMAQIGLQMLANSRGANNRPNSLGQVAGNAVLGYQQQKSSQADEELRRKYMQAQITKMGTPDPQTPSAPVIITGPDGKPRYATREEAIGQQPYMEPQGSTQGPGEIEIARILNDPHTPDAVKKDLRSLIEKKYGGQQQSEPLVAIQTPDGRQILVPRSQAANQVPAATRENPSEGERTSANYLGRMEAAEKLLGDYTPGAMDYFAATRVMESGPIVAGAFNKVLSGKGQQYYQAAADWVRAKLRKESGAVISPEEMAQEIKTYFPVPGDTAATREQKRIARLQAAEGFKGMSGRAAAQAPAAQNPNDPLGIR